MYVCSLRTNKWSYDHRQEGAALGQKMSYIRQTAGDRGALKDIQIFGMSSWLRQVHDAVLKLQAASSGLAALCENLEAQCHRNSSVVEGVQARAPFSMKQASP